MGRRLRLRDKDPYREEQMFIEEKENYVEPESWTLVTALDRILSVVKGSCLNAHVWEDLKNPLAFLREKLEMSNAQLVILAMLIDSGKALSWKEMGTYLGCSRLTMMTYTEEIEGLIERQWVLRKASCDFDGRWEGYALERGVITAIRHGETFCPQPLGPLSAQEFADRLDCRISSHMQDNSLLFEDDEQWIMRLVGANLHLPLCQEVEQLSDDIHVKSLFLMLVYDYVHCHGQKDEGWYLTDLRRLYGDDLTTKVMLQRLQEGNHQLFRRDLVEYGCEDGMADREHIFLSESARMRFLSDVEPRVLKPSGRVAVEGLILPEKIQEKSLFYNAEEESQMMRLVSLLEEEKFRNVQERLQEQGMRKGFACLFHGAPGTGKTESVLQIARLTGRSVMQVDIAGMRDKWVGESEKNIKKVFSSYRSLCESSSLTPILFFNEADALINRRNSNAERSVEKMENAMQNILLQEIERLDGILIATTNLTSNLDKAFERRFLFKVEFRKPSPEVKARIWRSMIPDMSGEDASVLSSRYDFSGGQIENIARMKSIDYVLNGTPYSLERVDEFCRGEKLDNGSTRQTIAGFRI